VQRQHRTALDFVGETPGERSLVGVLGDGFADGPVEVGVDVPDAGVERALVRHDEFHGFDDVRVLVEEPVDGVCATGFVAVDAPDDGNLGLAAA